MLAPGARIGKYEILEPIGEGGMGEVWKARDTTLERKVALKTLPDALANDAGRLARLEREAKLLAALNHPNIAGIHGFEKVDGTCLLELELVKGETLGELLEAGPVATETALEIALQMSEALEAAHAKGIVHRDLKPSNVIVTRDETVKVLDFGLAKAIDSSEAAHSCGATVTHLTREGVIAGTPAYMSPEHIRGGAVDAQEDIWAFGCILFEMLAGRSPFVQESATATLGKVLEGEPDFELLRPGTPAPVERLIRRCLEKDPRDRLHHISDARIELQDALSSARSEKTGTAGVREGRRRWTRPSLHRKLGSADAKRKWSASPNLALLLGAVIVTTIVLLLTRYVPGRLSNFERPIDYDVGRTEWLTRASTLELDPALSPDGRLFAYAAGPIGRTDIYVREILGGEPQNLTEQLQGTHGWPRWSPDGTQIAFRTRLPRSLDIIHISPAPGGNVKAAIRAPYLTGHAWSPDGTEIAYTQTEADSGLYRQSIEDGTPAKLLVAADDPNSPTWAPDGSRIAFVSGNSPFAFAIDTIANIAPSTIWVASADDGEARPVTDNADLNASPEWAKDSRSLFFISDRDGTRDLYQAPLPESDRVPRTARRLTTGLNAHTLGRSLDGDRLIYSVLISKANIGALPIPEDGPIAPDTATPITSGNQTIEGIDVSSDGTWLVFDSNRSGNQDIYKMNLSDRVPIQLTDDPSDDFVPSWSPDDEHIAFYSFRNGNRDLFLMSADGNDKQQLTFDPAEERYPDWSFDGNDIAFFSDKTGRQEVFVLSRPEKESGWTGPKQITFYGGWFPKWSPDSRSIAYLTMAFGTNSRLAVESLDDNQPAEMFDLGFETSVSYHAWSRNGQSIYVKALSADGVSGIWSIPLLGGKPMLLVSFENLSPSGPNRQEFAADDSRFYFTLSERDSDIKMMQLVELAR